MRRLLLTYIIVVSLSSLVQPASHAAGCLPSTEYPPRHVKNPENLVTFVCASATPFDLVRAVGIQTRMPIGIEPGEDRSPLEETRQSYDLRQVSAAAALQLAVSGTGYSIHEADGVTILVAGDLAPRQQMLIDHTFTDFKSQANDTMISQGFCLQMWLGALVEPRASFAGSILGSPDDELFTLVMPGPRTTEAIANLIVSQGSKGLWVLRVDPSWTSGASGVSLEIGPYQHYSQAAIGSR